MAGKRFKELGMDSFFGNYVYERVVPRDHFLVKLNQVIDWDSFTDILLPAYQGQGATGRPPYPPVVILTMLVISAFRRRVRKPMAQFRQYRSLQTP